MINRIKQTIVLIVLITITWLCYQPGLTGGYMFDDANNLGKLSIIDNEMSLDHIKSYLGESKSGPLKRPISVFSFLIDGQHWPTSAYPFKRTNLIIHLINGVLLFTLMSLVFKQTKFKSNKILFASGFVAAIWLLHPFLVSTTLYIVQRMAMLPLTFMLLGFCLYVVGRKSYHENDGQKGHWWLFSSVYLMTLMAMLSKENGIVFVWLVYLFESFVILSYLKFKPLNPKLKLWLLKLPTFVAIILFILQIPSFIADYDLRQYNMGERLISQFRAMTLYLYHWFIPKYFTEGVFTDGFMHSESLFKPITTLFSTLLILALIVVAWVKRKQWVWFSFALFFFIVAQVLESTIVPLELYFEHRVYVASIFLSVPLILWINSLGERSGIFIIIPFLLTIVLAGATYLRSNIWSDNLQLHELSTAKFPESLRARMGTAGIYDKMGLASDARRIVREGFQFSDNLELLLHDLGIQCVDGTITKDIVNDVVNKMKARYFIKNDHYAFVNMVELMFENECLGSETNTAIFKLADALENNPNKKFNQKTATAKFIKAQILFNEKQYELAKNKYIEFIKLNNDDYEAMNTTIILFINVKEFELAKEILELEEYYYDQQFRFKIDWLDLGGNLKGLRELIEMEINEKKDKHNHSREE